MPNTIFKKVPIQVQNKSGFNASHTNTFTSKCGQLVPILCDPVIPNTDINLDIACEVQLPPSVADFYGNIEARMEMFFVPNRIVWGGWKYFITNFNGIRGAETNPYYYTKYIPGINIPPDGRNNQLLGPGSLADFLGYKNTASSDVTGGANISNALPFISYHLIWDHFYRDSRIEKPLFSPVSTSSSTLDFRFAPYHVPAANVKPYYNIQLGANLRIFDLHQRCWDRDYFTNATYEPQAGVASSLEFEVDVQDAISSGGSPDAPGKGSFSISALRAANSLQLFEERNNLAGQRYADQIYARFGCYPADAITDRPIYLGSKRFNVYKRSVYQQTSDVSANANNPFNGLLANKTTSLGGFGNGKLGKFKVTEHGFIFVIFSLVPQAVYSTGTRRYLNYNTLTDFPDPLLQSVGDQPIYQAELKGNYPGFADDDIFGYTQRYAEAKFMNDEVHGLLRDGSSLSGFQLQRTFDTDQTLGADFIKIPQDYLDQISNTTAKVSDFGCWCQVYFDYKKVMPLSAFSLPTLGDPKDTHTQIINNGGTRL